jgi:hypothetical protein
MTIFISQAFYTQAGYKSGANISGSPGSGGITLKVDKVIIAGAAIIVVLAIILVIAGVCGACAFLASVPGTHGSFGQTSRRPEAIPMRRRTTSSSLFDHRRQRRNPGMGREQRQADSRRPAPAGHSE